jgi:hypothetical protein
MTGPRSQGTTSQTRLHTQAAACTITAAAEGGTRILLLLSSMPRRPDPFCEMCKSNHPNFSSYVEKMKGTKKSNFEYYCKLCQKIESVKNEDTHNIRKLIISDSTLFNCWNGREKSKEHIDLEVHNGAKVKDLDKIIDEGYLRFDKSPIEIILIAGLNDLTDKKYPNEASKVLDDIDDLKKKVKHHNKKSVVSVATVPLVPKHCSLNIGKEKKGTFYDLLPENNKIDEFEALNAGINAINKRENVKSLKMHTVGVNGKGIGKQRRKVHRKEDASNHKYFFEDGDKKMHLMHCHRYKFFEMASGFLVAGLRKEES